MLKESGGGRSELALAHQLNTVITKFKKHSPLPTNRQENIGKERGTVLAAARKSQEEE